MILFRSGKEDAGVYGAAGGLGDSLLAIMLLHHICCYLGLPGKVRCAGTFSAILIEHP